MGYRSDVRIRMKKGGYKLFKEYVDKESKKIEKKENNGYDYNLLNSTDIFKEYEKDIYFGWDYVKWYDGFNKDVDVIMNGLDYLSDKNESWRFARIGEDYTDIEENEFDDGSYDLDYINIIRCFDEEEGVN